VTRVVALAALLGALLVGVAPAASVAPGKAGSIVFANGDALGRGSVLELADPNGRGAPRVLTARALSAAMPAVSPDGTRVAFASLAQKGGGIEILTLSSPRAIERVTSVPGDVDPAWSPDGTKLAFARLLPKGGHQLMTVAASGGAVAKVAGAFGRRPDYAPDGKRIVFQLDGARSGIAVVAASGGGLAGLGAGASPSWSPNGLTIAFTASVSGASHLFLVGPDGVGRRDITHFSPVSQPSWSPDGSHLVLVTRTAAGTCCGLVIVDATGNGQLRITHGLVFASRPVWASAG
jgi:Tol biopolymer transport system component